MTIKDKKSGGAQAHQIRDRIEAGFGAWGLFAFRHAWAIIALSIVILGGMMTQLQYIRMDTSTEGFLHEDAPIRVAYNKFRHQFGRDERLLVIVESENGVFQADFLEKLRDLHEDLAQNTPKLQDIKSIINARDTFGRENELVVQDLFEDWPDTSEKLEAIKQRALSNPNYINNFISKDGKIATILIENDAYSSIGQAFDPLAELDSRFDAVDDESEDSYPPFLSGEENTEIVLAVEAILEKHRQQGLKIQVAGTPLMVYLLMDILGKDMTKFTGLSIIVIALFLFLLFRRLAIVFLPLLVAILSMLFTVSFMACIDIPLSTAMQIMPSFLLAVGVGNSVHIFTAFFQAVNRGDGKQEALAHAMQHSGLAVVMTSLTTAGGLVSFITADVKPVADFGVITPLGIISALIFSIGLLPALIAVFPIKEGLRERETPSLALRFLLGCGHLASTRPWTVISGFAAVLAVSAFYMIQVPFSHDPVKWFQKDHPFRVATETLNDRLGGGMFLEVLIDTQKENGIQNPVLLHKIDEIYDYAATINENNIYIGKTVSILDINKELHKALNENREAFYTIPDNQQLIAQELLLFENSGADDLEELVDSQFSKARITMKLPFIDAINYGPFQLKFEKKLKEIIGDSASVTVTGLMGMMGETLYALIFSMVKSYIIAFAIITPLMVMLIGSFRVGLVSMIPNLTPIIITLGLMGIFHIPLDTFTLLIGSIALGLAVDDTIHFMHNFQRYYKRSGNAEQAIHQTLQTTGQAIFFTSLVLSTGFFIFTLATMQNMIHFGLLTGFCIIMAFLSDVLLAPALVTLLAKISGEKGLT
ncbi:MAG: MMPL family transporter [Pseudomonadales bacterium]|nr:MMPL family transporter [Pseudomonadales bacterium]